jgi:hypothetical protein
MIMWAGVAGVAVAIAGTFLIGTSGAYSLFMGAVAVVALAADWWSWKVLTWDPIEGTPGV